MSMSHRNMYRYHRSSSYDLNALIYWFLMADNELRTVLKLDPQRGLITFLTTTFFFITIALCLKEMVSLSYEKVQKIQGETEHQIPSKESTLNVRPGYNCIYDHLQQSKIFQENTRKELHKEQLEIEILNNRVSCINNLLKPEQTYKVETIEMASILQS